MSLEFSYAILEQGGTLQKDFNFFLKCTMSVFACLWFSRTPFAVATINVGVCRTFHVCAFNYSSNLFGYDVLVF